MDQDSGVSTEGVLIDGRFYATGWIRNDSAIEQFLADLRRSGNEPIFENAAPDLITRFSNDTAVFYWESEEKVLGRVLKSWNQGSVGSCVGFGYGRAVQDVLLNEIASGEPEVFPGAEVCPEVIYGGSRFEIGGGQMSGDGSHGVWAAKWVKDWGLVIRGVYGTLDLRSYVESTCRSLGRSGIPSTVEAVAKSHPIREVAQLTTKEGLWAALGAGKGVPVCSSQGFTRVRDADGFCRLNGTWNHCMCYRGRFVHPARGRCVIEQNSWGDYLERGGNPPVHYVSSDGSVRTFVLPEGCFCVELDTASRSLAYGDTFVLGGLSGWSTPFNSAQNCSITLGLESPVIRDGSFSSAATLHVVNGKAVVILHSDFGLPVGTKIELARKEHCVEIANAQGPVGILNGHSII